jgi:hypothetical protein
MPFEIALPSLKLTKLDLLEDLKRVSKLVGGNTMKRADYEKYGRYAYTSFRNHFGSWKNALEAAGLNRARNWGATSDELLENLEEVWVKLGRQPKYSEMTIPFSRFSSTAYAHKFGSWTKTLIAFKEYVDGESARVIEGTPSPVDSGRSADAQRTKRDPNWRLRFKVMQRDFFRCVACGRSPAKDPNTELHVDHIMPWSKGGETVYENLQTLCKKCNLGKGNMV